MKDGYNLVYFRDIKHDKKNERLVVGVDYEVIANLGTGYNEEEVFKICKDNRLEFGIIMIVKVENGKVSTCCNMVFSYENEETDKIEWWLDCCEWDFRVMASVAFNNNELL